MRRLFAWFRNRRIREQQQRAHLQRLQFLYALMRHDREHFEHDPTAVALIDRYSVAVAAEDWDSQIYESAAHMRLRLALPHVEHDASGQTTYH